MTTSAAFGAVRDVGQVERKAEAGIARMQALDPPEQDPSGQGPAEKDPLARFRSWRGFLFASVALNLLFVYGMLAGVSDPRAAIWYKVLAWLPFNVIATRSTSPSWRDWPVPAAGRSTAILCLVMIVANWAVLLGA